MGQLCIGPICIPTEAFVFFIFMFMRFGFQWFKDLLGIKDPNVKEEVPSSRPVPGKRTWTKGLIKIEDKEHFETVKAEAAKVGVPIVIDFTATWCGPCKSISPYFEELSKAYNGAFIKVDVDQADDVAASFNVKSMPTFIVLDKQGKEVVQFSGAIRLRLEKAVSSWCSLVKDD